MTFLSDDLRTVLGLIVKLLSPVSEPWAFTGSVGMALQGLSLPVEDIDIQTNEAGAYQIQERLSDFLLEGVHYRESSKIRSHFGVFKIHDFDVEVMGDVEKITSDGAWIGPPDLPSIVKTVELDSFQVPVLDLGYEREAYRILGRLDRMAQIDEFIENNFGLYTTKGQH